jgi:hypothetical protein
MRRLLLTVLAAVPLAAGCAYYNGLFNANRLAGEARKAEREGRTSEARSLWSRAAVKAESVSTRFTRSRYRDDALVLQGLALSRLGACTAAIPPLRVAADSSPDGALRSQAHLLLGRCWLALEAPDSAMAALGPVADTATPARNEALMLRGRARLRLGDAEGALRDLTASEAPEGVFPRAIALTALDRVDEAAGLLGAVVDSPYVEEGWLSALDSLGARDRMAAADLVDRLASGRLGAGQRARLLLRDGERWERAAEPARAVPRFEAIAEAVPDSAEGRVARARLTMGQIRRTTDIRAVVPLLDSLRSATRAGGPALQLSIGFIGVLSRAQTALTDAGSPLGLFLAAEDTRDSLAAPRLAAALFAEVEQRFPESVVAPKALLALALLRPGDADSLVAILHARYPESVYTLALSGQGSERYRVVEDSLRALGREQRRQPPGPVDRTIRQEP